MPQLINPSGADPNALMTEQMFTPNSALMAKALQEGEANNLAA